MAKTSDTSKKVAKKAAANDKLDEEQLVDWIKQVSLLPGEKM